MGGCSGGRATRRIHCPSPIILRSSRGDLLTEKAGGVLFSQYLAAFAPCWAGGSSQSAQSLFSFPNRPEPGLARPPALLP
jgi:hypothetical protein